MNPSNLDAVIVGAGPTGLALALDLQRYGMNIRIVDKESKHSDLSKATVLMPRTIEEFGPRGLIPAAIRAGERAISLSAFSHGKMIFNAFYNNLESEYSFLLHVPQSTTEGILRDHLANKGAEIEWDTEVTGFEQDETGVTVSLKKTNGSVETVRAAWLCGCDGAHSLVRHLEGFEFKGGDYKDNWLLADVKIDWRFPHGHTYLFFGSEGLFAVFPMPEGRFRIYVVELASHSQGRPPTLEEMQTLADAYVPDGCRISDARWLSEFRCHHRRVESYAKGRVLIGGDAAHIHSPESGLGMNTGIQDSFNLGWKIAYIQKGWAKPELIETYSLERTHVGKQVLEMSDRTHRIWAQYGTLAEFIRAPMWRFFSNHFLHHTEKLEEAVQIRIKYPESDFVRDVGDGKSKYLGVQPAIVAGMQADNPPVQSLEHADETFLLQHLDFSCYTLLIFTGSHSDPEHLGRVADVVRCAAPYESFMRPAIIVGGQDGSPFTVHGPLIFLDPTLFAHFRYSAQEGGIFVLRPDLYIAYSERGLNTTKNLARFLTTTLNPVG